MELIAITICVIFLIKNIKISRNFTGFIGELYVNNILKKVKGTTYVFRDIALPSSFGTTQIDHILITKKGVFVFETKNYQGIISGQSRDKKWTQIINNNSYSFMNPIHQNYKHTEACVENLKINKNKVHSVVIFLNKAKLNTRISNVMNAKDILNYLDKFNQDVLTKDEVQQLTQKLYNTKLHAISRTAHPNAPVK